MALHLNLIQISSLKIIKPSFSYLPIGKLFWTGRNTLLWWLKYLLAFYLNICGTIKVSSWTRTQLIHSIPERWKFIMKENYEQATNLHDHHQCYTQQFFWYNVGNIYSDTQSVPMVGWAVRSKKWNCAFLQCCKMYFPSKNTIKEWGQTFQKSSVFQRLFKEREDVSWYQQNKHHSLLIQK